MKRALLSFGFTIVLALQGVGQNTPIPEALLRNSNAIIRLSSLEFIYHSPTSATLKSVEEITILNSTGDGKGDFSCYVDPTITLKSFSGELRGPNGNVIRKLKRADLKYTEYSATSLADDGAVYYMEVIAPVYPYTVRIEHERAFKNGILGFPPFMPILSTGTALEVGRYTVSMPQSVTFNYKNTRISEPEKSQVQGRDIYTWKIENTPAIKAERYSPPLLELIPYVYTAPNDFQYENTQGTLRNWAEYGRWMCKLLEGRDVLPEALRQEVHRRTDHLVSPREKVRALYDYLGESTRYVSIQLGIGGQQPSPAQEVYKAKFGDCKGLSNYMMAMLKECGITSEYVIIDTQRPRMFSDFASPNQANHAILSVPLENERLWLECTNTDFPFGYVHEDIAGHDAIIFRNGIGEFVTLPQYADTLNRLIQNVEVTLSEDGFAQGHISERFEVHQYESKMYFSKKSEKQRTDMLLGNLKVPLILISNITSTEQKESQPWIEISYDFESPKYMNVTGSRGFLPLIPFTNFSTFKDKERQNDIHYAQGYLDITTVTIQLPENLKIESLPKSCQMSCSFGSFSQTVSADQGKIVIVQKSEIRAGTQAKEQFEEFRAFITARATTFSSNIILKRM